MPRTLRSQVLLLSFATVCACDGTTGPDMPEPIAPPGFGTAVTDGVVNDAEWVNSQTFQVFDEHPDLVGSVLHVLNDATTMYFGLRTPFTELSDFPYLEVRFDNGGNGELSDGDDGIRAGVNGFLDLHLGEGRQYRPDSIKDGAGAISLVGGVVHSELEHPLSSGDPQDVAYIPGQRISICLRFYLPDFTSGAAPDFCFLASSVTFMDVDLATVP